jgi:hypothetical protein
MGGSAYSYEILYFEALGRGLASPDDHYAPVAKRRHKIAQDFSSS